MVSKPFFSIHNHSRYSKNDALPQVPGMVEEADHLGYPALGLTDHGCVSGNLQLYKACRQRGIEPLPGVELYVTPDREARIQGHNLHLTVVAYSEQGYRNLCRLTTLTARNHYYLPRVDLADLAEMADQDATAGLAIGTGCWFGLVPTVIREQGYRAAVALTETLAGWFPRVYVELQSHDILPEDQRGDAAWMVGESQLGEQEMVEQLIAVAEETGVPYIITTDAHYIKASDQPLHDGLKALCSWSDSPDDAVFPGGPYSMMSGQDLKMYFEPDVVDSACATLSELAEVASVRIPAIDTFRMLVPDVSKTDNVEQELFTLVMAGLARLIPEEPKATRKRRMERIYEELEIIGRTGFANYLLLNAELCDYMLAEDIVFNARGSANNSEVNYCLGITNVDSFADGLRFERFISEDRIRPPDIDYDIEHERRDQVVEWAAGRYTVCQVGTLMKYSMHDDEGTLKGSLRGRYFATLRKQGGTIEHSQQIPPAHKALLNQLSDMDLISGYGTHAAGLILAPDPASIAELPMVHIGSGKASHLVTAYYKDDVEDLGFIKVDLLGLRTLTAVAIATDLITEETGEDLTPMAYLRNIPLNDSKVFSRMARGQTEGVFQLQERPAMDFVRRMKPRSMRDVIAAMALIRPAARTSDTAATYLDRRSGNSPIPPMHEDLWAETKKTYGTIVYQEQVIGLCRTIGMSMPDLNKVLKALKASNEYTTAAKVVLADALPRITILATDRGWAEADIAILLDAIGGYGDYGFNEGHADAYGRMAYYTCWLAENWPAQWWSGVLYAYANSDNEERYVKAARRYGVRVIGAHVNRSDVSYAYDRKANAVRRGLLSVKGVGTVAATEIAMKSPYADIKDFAQRVLPSRVSGVKAIIAGTPLIEIGGVVGALNETGAFDGLE